MKGSKDLSHLIYLISQEDCEKSFREFYDIFFPQLFQTSLYYVKNNFVAEEVVSELFVKLWVKRSSLIKIREIKAYLFICAKRLSLNYLRNKKENPLYLNDIDIEVCVNLKTPEDNLLSEEELFKIRNAIDNLPEKCRLVFLLVKERGMKYKHVATILGISEKMVEKHISTALKKLRMELSVSTYNSSSIPNIVKSLVGFLLLVLS
ncbi:RNA polymerase sigma factor [Echinicola shivajiensis]|uniref:RNA polymerase sigma factor n=1 Tax=Echinicola shivajiensis TaxID=1035916 RepID=UPI001BFC143A|nr:RNA polymerase sigma-70 factor [Echinicola shivajiensis]